MAFYEEDRNWDAFFTTEPESEIKEWIKIYHDNHDSMKEGLEDMDMTISDIKDTLKNALDLNQTMKANLVVLEKMYDSAEWALERIL